MNPIAMSTVYYALYKEFEKEIRERQAEGFGAIRITRRQFRQALSRRGVTDNRGTASAKWDAAVFDEVIVEEGYGAFIDLARLCLHAHVPVTVRTHTHTQTERAVDATADDRTVPGSVRTHTHTDETDTTSPAPEASE